MNEEKRGELVKIGALWESTTKQGDTCLTGKMGDAMLLVFKNKFKEQGKQPDYIVYVAKPTRKDEPVQADLNYGFDEPAVSDNPHIVNEDDIPF